MSNSSTSSNASNARISSYGDKQEKAVNEVVHAYFQAGYNYINIAQALSTDRAAYQGFSRFFENAATRVWAEASASMRYQNQRGSNVQLRELGAPKDVSNDVINRPQNAFQEAIHQERRITEQLNATAAAANDSKDAGLQEYAQNLLARQTRYLKDLSDIFRMVDRSRDDKAAIDQLDRELRQNNGYPRLNTRAELENRALNGENAFGHSGHGPNWSSVSHGAEWNQRRGDNNSWADAVSRISL
jgi:ferritin